MQEGADHARPIAAASIWFMLSQEEQERREREQKRRLSDEKRRLALFPLKMIRRLITRATHVMSASFVVIFGHEGRYALCLDRGRRATSALR